MSCWLCGFETTELATNAKAPTCNNEPCRVCIDVAEVDEEINQAVVTLRRLIAKRCDLRSEQNRVHETLIHPLPAELKNYIFELVLPLRDEWGEITRTEETVMPSYLARVCRGWRDVAWSNPSLWSTIHIAIGTRNSTSAPSSRINSVNDWIQRSGTLPLRMLLRDNGGSEDELKGMIDAISQCSNRWHSLSLDIPRSSLRTFHLSDFQCHLLKKLRIVAGLAFQTDPLASGPFLFLNPKVCPEKVEIHGAPFHSLQISCNHLTSVKVGYFNLEEITQVFQHALQMTSCHIWYPYLHTQTYVMPPIIHHRLKTFGLRLPNDKFLAAKLLGPLTLPSLREFHTNVMFVLTRTYLPALVHQSSCLLTRLTLYDNFEGGTLDELQPLPGVTDLVLEALGDEPAATKKLLLDGYLPDLRRLTLRVQPFVLLWARDIITPLLDRNRSPNEGGFGLCNIIVVDEAVKLDNLWKSDVRKQLKALNIRLRDDGFEL